MSQSTTAGASPNTHILPIGMSESTWKLPELLAELERRRVASQLTNNPIEQTGIARAMGVSPSHVSRLESGARKLSNLPGEQLYIFLRGYRFTPLEIKGIVAVNNFNFPPQLMDETAAAPLGTVMVLHEGTVSRPGEPQHRPVQEEFLRGEKPERVRTREVAVSDLATRRAQEAVAVGTLLLHKPSGKPVNGSIVIVEVGDKQALAVWPLEDEGEWAAPYGPSPLAPVMLTRAEVTLIGVALGGYIEFPTGS